MYGRCKRTLGAILASLLLGGCAGDDGGPGTSSREVVASGDGGASGAATFGPGGSGGAMEPPGPYPGAAQTPGSTAIAMDDPGIVGWASGWVDPPEFGSDVDEQWRQPSAGLGPAQGVATEVVVLGNGGRLTLTFDPPITDGDGFDLAVFENGYSDTFLELAYVEVSSDGVTFARFPSSYLGDEPVAQFGAHDPTLIDGLAGKYRLGYGSPFNLADLASQPEVQSGSVELSRIGYVRLVDVVGDGSALDGTGRPIYDPYPTVGSGGFDLDGIAVLHAAE